MRRRARLLGRVTVLAAAGAVLTWLTVRHMRSAGEGGAPRGPRDILMGRRLSQAVPTRLAGLPRTRVLSGAEARTSLAAVAGDLPLLEVCGGRFGDPPRLTLWVGESLSAAQAERLAQETRAGAGATAFAAGSRLFLFQGEAGRVEAAVQQLRGGDREGRRASADDSQQTGEWR